MTDRKLMKQLQDSMPTNQRMYKGTVRKAQLLARYEHRTVPNYLAALVDREFDQWKDHQ